MEKEPQMESMAAVNMKPEYAPSEVYAASEAPPAYHKSKSSSVQIAKIIAVTVVVCSIILGSFLLASAYVSANSSCRQLEQELELLGEAADRFQPPPQPEALIQEEPLISKRHSDHYPTEEPPKAKELETNSIDGDDESESERSSEEEQPPVRPGQQARPQLRLPSVPMDMDDLVASLLEKNQQSKMNCVVEKKKAEEFVDHQPKTIQLPFGVNLTTNPRFEKISGERMVIVCESGSMQRAQPPTPPPQQSEEGEDEDDDNTIMIQPVMIPIPQSPFRTHMPQQMPPVMRMPHMPEGSRPMHPPTAVAAQLLAIEGMRPPVPPSSMRQPQVQHISRIQIQARPQMIEEPQMQIHQMPSQMQQSGELPPNPILRHIVQQIIAQKIMESQRAREMQMREEQQRQQQPPVEVEEDEGEERRLPLDGRFHIMAAPVQRVVQSDAMGQRRIPIPEEVLTQLNRLPNREVIVAVQESEPPQDDERRQQQQQQPRELRFVQEQRQNAAEVNGRQAAAFAPRGLSPVDIPVAMMMPQMEERRQQQQVVASSSAATAAGDSEGNDEETRPHFLQPRSV